MESAVVLAFYLLTTYLSVSHYRLISNNIYWNDKSQQLWRYVADRTGIMAYATLPLIWIFAGRNNVFMWATGLSYRTFNIYHRHIARAGTILAIVHSAVYTWLFVESEGWSMFKREFTQLWLLLGVVATITMCLLLLFSVSWLRVKFYEIFLVLHIVLSVITLAGCFFSTLAQPAAGQFYYLYQPGTWQGYENHPFTLGAWCSQSSASEDADTYLLQHDDLPNDSNRSNFGPKYQATVRSLTFWVRPYDGWTRRLRDECLLAPTQAIEPTILLEGPYGHHYPISSFDSVLLIAGGTGIASAVPYILEHVALSKAGSSDTTHMHLLWTARQASFIEEVFAQELRTVAQRDDFSADLFFTQQSETPKHGEEQPRGEEREYLRSKLQHGRPDIAAAIAKAATRAELTGTKVAVLVCGPPAMADEARLAVHHSLKHGCNNLEYLEESFGW
ncbi:putative plasma membrane ferric-chelate reductase, partial [Aureobasidium melanogenum]